MRNRNNRRWSRSSDSRRRRQALRTYTIWANRGRALLAFVHERGQDPRIPQGCHRGNQCSSMLRSQMGVRSVCRCHRRFDGNAHSHSASASYCRAVRLLVVRQRATYRRGRLGHHGYSIHPSKRRRGRHLPHIRSFAAHRSRSPKHRLAAAIPRSGGA